MGESAFVTPPDEVEKKEEEIKKVKVRISLFFDGTLNNRINIDQRIEDEKNPGSNAIYQKYKGGDNSYEGDYTNIAKMERYIDDATGYQVSLSSYTEGPGTDDRKADALRGYAFGTGKTGITKKVEKGIEDAVDQIEQKIKKGTVIEILTADVFGFSRGAAGARNCIYEVLSTGKNPIKTRIEEKGYEIEKVEVCFAGLYDTVASHGIIYSNDTSDLNLTAINQAKKVIQLAAAEEHRKKFNLTSIESAGYKGRQYFLPGVHSDIGGGYRAPASGKPSEKNMGIYWSLSQQSAEQEKKRLIESGWYNEGEIKIVHTPSIDPSGFDEYTVEVTREKISNEYSRIPLHVMARFAGESGISLKDELESDEKVSSKLNSAREKIEGYISNIGENSKAQDWLHNEGWLKELRHDHLHFSAHLSIAHAPRFRNYQRTRRTYYG
ncbi:MAG: DUF2235 domain-containing protein [Gammaproteobacteria bacterium]|nr:DUF2235 domain-containing protein [Gammaproteobacteria bacterium]